MLAGLMRIFMTGATGFIGSYLAHGFLEAGHELVILARDPNKLRAWSEHPRIQRIDASLDDRAAIRTGLSGAEACVHVALGWGDTPLTMLENDTRASVFLLEAALEAGVAKFIYTSSTAAIGSFYPNMSEADPLRPSDFYGATKAATEAYVLAVGAKSRMQCNVIRPGYTFGNPVVAGGTTQPDRRFHQIADAAKRGADITLDAGDGTQFIWAGDLARLYGAVLGSNQTREVYFGLGTPFVTWQGIAELACELSASESRIEVRGRGSEPSLFNLTKIRRDFGLEFSSEGRIAEHLRYLLA